MIVAGFKGCADHIRTSPCEAVIILVRHNKAIIGIAVVVVGARREQIADADILLRFVLVFTVHMNLHFSIFGGIAGVYAAGVSGF